MVYRRLDPGADWDAWCDDHPEPPQPEDVPEECHVYVCPCCGYEYGEDDFNDAAATVHVALDGAVYCTDCCVDGAAPECDLEIDWNALEACIRYELTRRARAHNKNREE